MQECVVVTRDVVLRPRWEMGRVDLVAVSLSLWPASMGRESGRESESERVSVREWQKEIERKREGVDERRRAGTMGTRSESEEAKSKTTAKGGKGASFPGHEQTSFVL